MRYVITNECTSCRACEEECPADAILSGGPHHDIDAGACDGCPGIPEGPLCVLACPIDCIVAAAPSA